MYSARRTVSQHGVKRRWMMFGSTYDAWGPSESSLPLNLCYYCSCCADDSAEEQRIFDQTEIIGEELIHPIAGILYCYLLLRLCMTRIYFILLFEFVHREEGYCLYNKAVWVVCLIPSNSRKKYMVKVALHFFFKYRAEFHVCFLIT